MARLAVLLAALTALVAAVPQTGTLKVTVTVAAADGRARPVARHALLVSDDPVTSAPQRFVTKGDGTVEVHLRPGRYLIESDDPFIFEGKAYQWSQPVKITAGAETTLALTAANAMVEAAKPGAAPSAADEASAEGSLLVDWQDSIVTIWSSRAVGHGFLIDARGFLLTNQRLIDGATDVEVQFAPTKKVAGRVVVSDPNKNVAVVWIDPAAAAAAKPVKLGYAQSDTSPVKERDKVYAIESRLGQEKSLVSGAVERLTAHTLASDVQLDRASTGVPIFDAAGEVVAISTAEEEASFVNQLSPRAVRVDDARTAIAEAEKKAQGAAPPSAAPLPVDPERPFPADALKSAAAARKGSASAYLVAANDFDVAIITPPMVYAAMHKTESDHFDYGGRNPAEMQPALRALEDFGGWSEYVYDAPPVVMIRVTPKFGEGFWTSVARGAAQTQGVAIPPIKRMKAPFGSLRLTCGDRDVAPIHPFRIGHRTDDGSMIDEGLYVFDPSAIGPQCGTVKVTLFAEKSDKGDTRVVDAKIVQQVWDDFAPYR